MLDASWAHARRKLHEVAQAGKAPIAEEGLRLINALYGIEKEIRGQDPAARVAQRQARSKPVLDSFDMWLMQNRSRVSSKSPLGEALKDRKSTRLNSSHVVSSYAVF